MFLFYRCLLLVDAVGLGSEGKGMVAGGGNLNNRTIWGWVWVAIDPRPTRGRPAGDPRKTPEKVAAGEILKIELFWQRRGVYQCTSRFYKLTRARVHV